MSESPHNLKLQEQLDAVRPDTDDLAAPEVREAAEVLKSSTEWQSRFESQQQIDRQLAAAMQDVDFPDAARKRLLEALAIGAASDTDDTSPPTPQIDVSARTINRRQWGYVVAAAGIAACIGLMLLFWTGGPPQFTLDEIRHEIPIAADGRIDLSSLPAFDESFELSQPTGRWERLNMDSPRGIDWTHDGRQDAALVPFVAEGPRPVRGYLLIVPASSVASPPESTVLSTTAVSYFPTENTAWSSSDGDLVYVCFVEPGQLRTLQRLLYPQSA